MSELIILAVLSGYFRQGVVWCVAAERDEKMRKMLKDFYYGNLAPGEQETVPNSELRRAMVKVIQCEQQLTEQLNEAEQIILNELVSAQHIVDSITALENFILGFLIPSIKYRDIYIGFTALTFCRWERTPSKDQAETPYTEEGRRIKRNHST